MITSKLWVKYKGKQEERENVPKSRQTGRWGRGTIYNNTRRSREKKPTPTRIGQVKNSSERERKIIACRIRVAYVSERRGEEGERLNSGLCNSRLVIVVDKVFRGFEDVPSASELKPGFRDITSQRSPARQLVYSKGEPTF